jgi:membrane associated rhomboid family serine protease
MSIGGRFNSGFGGGGSFRFGLGGATPPIVRQLVIVNLAIFVLGWMPAVDMRSLSAIFGFVPATVFSKGYLWQPLTYTFLHGGFIHILFNMLMLWVFGAPIAARWGTRDFLVYYVVCGIGGALVSWAFTPKSYDPVIGASAAVLGLVVAYAMMNPEQKLLLYGLIPIKAKHLVWLFVGFDLVSLLLGSRDGIAHFAHLGGMLTGFVYLKQDWRTNAMTRKFRAARARQKMRSQGRMARKAQAEKGEVDRILDKIHSQGMDSLTRSELEILRNASQN